MKAKIIFLTLFHLCIIANGQIVSSSVTSTAGDFFSMDGLTLGVTIGETAIDDYSTESLNLNCGYQQGTGNCKLSLKLFLEGLFNGDSLNQQAYDALGPVTLGGIADDINIKVAGSYYPYPILYTSNTFKINTQGESSLLIPAHISGNYYLAINHRNHIETWSSTPLDFANASLTYDFTTASSKAFGNNQKEVAPGVYALYAGDINQDHYIDETDILLLANSCNTFEEGYLIQDLNGDGIADALDLILCDNNAATGKTAQKP